MLSARYFWINCVDESALEVVWKSRKFYVLDEPTLNKIISPDDFTLHLVLLAGSREA